MTKTKYYIERKNFLYSELCKSLQDAETTMQINNMTKEEGFYIREEKTPIVY